MQFREYIEIWALSVDYSSCTFPESTSRILEMLEDAALTSPFNVHL